MVKIGANENKIKLIKIISCHEQAHKKINFDLGDLMPM